MLNAAAAFGGGIWVQNRLGDLPIPKISRAVDQDETFKLSVRVLSASIPGLTNPGLLTQERPRVETVLGGSNKQTELGDFKPDGFYSKVLSKVDADDVHCPWSFGDALTFTATHDDLLSSGLQVWVRTQSDIRFGPLQMSLSKPCDVGMCSVDIRRVVLPACAPQQLSAESNGDLVSSWDSSPMVFSLTHVGGVPSSERTYALGESAGYIALIFSVDTSPTLLLKIADDKTKPMVDRVANPLKEWTVRTAQAAADSTQSALQQPIKWVIAAGEAAGCREADEWEKRGKTQKSLCGGFLLPTSKPSPATTTAGGIQSPDLSPGGWTSTITGTGRTFWHHSSLGPAPWLQQDSPIRSNSASISPVPQHDADTNTSIMHEVEAHITGISAVGAIDARPRTMPPPRPEVELAPVAQPARFLPAGAHLLPMVRPLAAVPLVAVPRHGLPERQSFKVVQITSVPAPFAGKTVVQVGG